MSECFVSSELLGFAFELQYNVVACRLGDCGECGWLMNQKSP